MRLLDLRLEVVQARVPNVGFVLPCLDLLNQRILSSRRTRVAIAFAPLLANRLPALLRMKIMGQVFKGEDAGGSFTSIQIDCEW